MRSRCPMSGVIVLLAALLAGCNLAPPYSRPKTLVPITYKDTGLWQPAVYGALPREGWWRMFGDPTLDALEPRVTLDNPDLATALANYDQARAFAAEANANLYPDILAGYSNTANRQSDKRPRRGADQPNQYAANTFQGEIDYEVDLWGRIRNTIAAGKMTAQAVGADLAFAKLSLQADLANDYFDLRGLDNQTATLRMAVVDFRRALEITNARFLGKIASAIDVARARVQVDTAEAQLTEMQEQRALYEHAIAALIGQPASTFSIPFAATPQRVPKIPLALPSVLLERRPDIAAAERRAAAANDYIGVARAAFYPNLSLSLLGGFQNTGSIDLFESPYSFWTVGPELTLPIFEGGLLRAQEAAAYAVYRGAVANYRGVVLAAFQQVEDGLSALNLLGQEQQSQDAAVRDAQQEEHLANFMYMQGAINQLEVVIAETAALNAERTDIALRTRRMEAAVGLIRDLGGGWTRQDLPSMKSTLKLAANG